jgi:Rrf2 family cysteine metabolism transcriptional repressor
MAIMLAPTKKGQYALRAVFELAKRRDEAPIKISAIARAQAIPLRFLEVILHQLKGSGLVTSKRGFYGGYALTKAPEDITVGDILQYMQKDIGNAQCLACVSRKACPFINQCVFSDLWQRAKAATFTVYNTTTLRDLLDANNVVGIEPIDSTTGSTAEKPSRPKRSKRAVKD